ncbi:MAG TPA: universal stress protein [Methylomirabilota bacterium]|nr:universal stress protein [Methylomirabilota bacterium]
MNASVPIRLLLALHGHEPDTWPAELARVLATWPHPSVRVVAIGDGTSPAFTSLTPRARRMYAAARAAWREDAARRLGAAVQQLLPLLPPVTAVVRALAPAGEVARVIAAHAAEWPADIVVIGAPAPGLSSWLWPGPVHRDILGLTGCPVLVTPLPRRPTRWRTRARVIRLRPVLARPGV